MKVALVYDRVNKWGGAERLLVALHALFPDAPLYTSVYNSEKASWAKVFRIKTSFLQSFPGASSSHELYPVLMPIAFESFSFDEYDLVISIASEAAKGIITKPGTFHICYCLTPTRYLWSGYSDYFNTSFFRFITKPLVLYLRFWDMVASQRPDVYIAISKEVQGRIKKYYGRESEVIYPPVSLGAEVAHENFLVAHAKKQKTKTRDFNPANSHSENFVDSPRPYVAKCYMLNANNYFLVVSRLVGYKRIDIAINACNTLQLPLTIIGVGSEEKKLRNIAGSTITFLGSLTDEELVRYYKGCRALIFPGKEDLGLTVLEAQRFGKPVIAFGSGGALETIVEGKTGEFFPQQNTRSLVEVLKKFDENKYGSKACRENAEKFSYALFKKEFMKCITDRIRI